MLDTLASMFNVACLAFTIILVTFMLLIALPQSQLRMVLMRVITWVFGLIAAICGMMFLNPIDFIPDLIPLLGQLDDGGYLAGLVTSVLSGIYSYRESRRTQRIIDHDSVITKRLK